MGRPLSDSAERDAILAQIEEQRNEQKFKQKQARAAENEAQSILNAIYDLKAVNPNARDTRDRRTPSELLTIIEDAQREISESIRALRAARNGVLHDKR